MGDPEELGAAKLKPDTAFTRAPSSPMIEISEEVFAEPLTGTETIVPEHYDPDEMDREIDKAIESIGVKQIKPPEENGTLIGTRAAPYISDAAFAAVGGATLDQREPSSPSVNERRRIIIDALQKVLGIKHWPRIDKVHIEILDAAEALYIREETISDEDMLRKVLLLTLFSLSPKNYSPNDPLVMKLKRDALQRALIAEFKKRGKRDLAAKLEMNRSHLSGQHKAVKP